MKITKPFCLELSMYETIERLKKGSFSEFIREAVQEKIDKLEPKEEAEKI